MSLKDFVSVRSDFDVVAFQKRQKAAESMLVPSLVRFVTVCKLVHNILVTMLRG